jgi:hypothetical protein
VWGTRGVGSGGSAWGQEGCGLPTVARGVGEGQALDGGDGGRHLVAGALDRGRDRFWSGCGAHSSSSGAVTGGRACVVF